MKKIIAIFSLIILFSCGGKEGKKDEKNAYTKPESTGRINHIMVVVNPDDWKGKLSNAFQELIGDVIPGLPQPEYPLNISTIPHHAFNKMFKNSRNLLVLDIADKEVFRVIKDKYSQPQTIIEFKAPSIDALVKLMETKGAEIVKTFKEEDLKITLKEFRKNRYSKKINTLSHLKVNMVIPDKYRMVMDTLNSFMWLRNHISGGIASGDQNNNIIAYQSPMFDDSKPLIDQIIKNRDSIGKAFIKGNDPETMYMITEAARNPVVKEVMIDGKKAYETRGTWEVFGAFMAGPFLNYSVIDEKNNRVIVLEGFNYAPSVKKRDFMFELEAILKSANIE
ncbi:DUF4837 family protein [Wenyingzhuangia sp. 1_MG-2023]|nr:DUF4837 family protein [Wenyingzhuangia sp. 1_MG-2023]